MNRLRCRECGHEWTGIVGSRCQLCGGHSINVTPLDELADKLKSIINGLKTSKKRKNI